MQDQHSNNPQKTANCDRNVAQPVDKSVVLIGLMGAGKTLMGGLVAKALGLEACDSDHIIEANAGCTISEIFATRGEAAFRELEYTTMETLLNGPVRVISAGGGIVVTEKTRNLLKAKAIPIWLEADTGELARRCAGSDARPLLKTGDPATILAGLLEKRAPLYAQTASFSVRTDTQPVDDTLALILDGIKACR